MAHLKLPGSWHVASGDRAGVTIIRGWDARVGLVVALAVGGLLFPLLLDVSVWAAVLVLLASIVVGLGLGYRLVIAPEGMVYQRTWYGVRWHRHLLPLQTPVISWSTFEQPEGEALVLESQPPITLPTPKEGVGPLKQALREAIQRASHAALASGP